ncbi:MAG: excinuclease ABC subunit B [Verrucomicrobiae bacterium]|nr:excinuclease ABC subunit B [Verrucomicrobiae bacterium]
MICDICKENEAKVHLTQIVDGKMQKVDLCEGCAKEKGVSDPTGFSLADLLLGLGAAEELKPTGESGASVRCPACGFTQTDFKKTGRLGCPECYRVFEPGLNSLMKAMHKSEQHAGKIPSRAMRNQELSTKLKTLETNLKKAVEEEKYEDAATLRDQIRALETQLRVKATT